ncbi:hypothetical protein AB0M43_07255 [Longispora sp. NPDC051575]|uniref:hypothetical protein n=1 Tax=Longispora sp. NPDC051575 TaxID=3154943 RepID=UPI003424BD51
MRYIRQLPLLTALVLGAAVAPATLAAAAPPAAKCTFQTGAHSEIAPKCVSAKITLDRLPAVGESTTVRIHVRSQVRVGTARLGIRLSDNLRLETAGTGLSAPRAVGLDHLAEQQFGLTDRGRVVTARVTALRTGPAQIQADVADADQPDQLRAAHGSTEFTVDVTDSRPGIASTDAPAVDTGPAAPVTASGQATPIAPRAPDATAPGQICATGQFTVANKNGTWLVGRNIPVAVQGRTTSSAALTTYASGLTGVGDGRYRLCFTAPVSTMYSVQVRFSTEASVWRVTNNAGTSIYTITTAAKYNVASGTDPNYGTTAPSSTHMRGWHAFDTMNILWSMRGSGTGCWTARETANCTTITLHWQPGSTDGTYFSPSGRYVAFADADPDSEHLVMHEAGHAFMDLLYNRWWPYFDCPNPHYLHKRSGANCAWTEGFANAVTGYGMGDGRFYWPNGQYVNLMSTAWYDPSRPASNTNLENGDWVESRVAGAMIDLWRNRDGGPARTFDLMRRYQSSSFREHFLSDRPLVGLDTSAAARNLVYTHTIDYR